MAQQRLRLAVLATHPVQYYAPLFRALSQRLDVHVFYAHKATPQQQAAAGFDVAFDWDLDLLTGYPHSFLVNRARRPDAGRFAGCDTPEIGTRLREGRFDAVLSLGWHRKSLLQGVWAAKRIGLPVLVRGDSQVPGARSQAKVLAKRLSYPTLLRTFDAALATGARSRDYYLHYDYPDERIFYSPHSVDTEWFRGRSNPAERAKLRSELGVAENEKLVLFAGKLVAFKRPLDVVEAAAIARSRGLAAQVVVAGSGELEGRLRQRAGTLNVPLHYLGFKNQTDMPAVYAAADVLVLPSDARETWGLVCNEALACTTPVIVSDAAGCAPDLAADGAAGRMYPAGDCEACAHALIALFDEPPSPRAIDEVSGRHSVARAADGVMAGLSAVVSRLQ